MKKLSVVIMSALFLGLISIAPAARVYADAADDLCAGVSGDACDNAAGEEVGSVIDTVVDILSIIVGVVSVIMIIVGGLKYITSGGDTSKITGAKNTILYAAIGLVVVAVAQVIARFVLTRTA